MRREMTGRNARRFAPGSQRNRAGKVVVGQQNSERSGSGCRLSSFLEAKQREEAERLQRETTR